MEANSIGVGPPTTARSSSSRGRQEEEDSPPPTTTIVSTTTKLRKLGKTAAGRNRKKNKKCISCQGPRADLQETSDAQQKRCSALLEKICVLQLDILSSHLARQYDTYLERIECQEEEEVKKKKRAEDDEEGRRRRRSNGHVESNNIGGQECQHHQQENEDGRAQEEGGSQQSQSSSSSSSQVSLLSSSGCTTETTRGVGVIKNNNNEDDVSSKVKKKKDNNNSMTAGTSCSSAPVISAAAVNAAAAAAAAEVDSKDPKSVWKDGNGASDLSVLHKIIEKIELNSSVGQTDAETLEKFSTFQSFDRIGKSEKIEHSSFLIANQDPPKSNNVKESQKQDVQQQQEEEERLQSGIPLQLQSQISNFQENSSSSGAKDKKEVNASDLNEKLVEKYSEKLGEEGQWLAVNMNRVLRETMQISKDWDETDSSCGDESCDEEIAPKYNDTDINKLPYLPFLKNPSASWALARAAAVTSWLWNHDAIAHVSFRLEQLDQVHRHLKTTKPTFQLEDKPLPGVMNPHVTPPPLQNVYFDVYGQNVPVESQKSSKSNYPNGHRLSTPNSSVLKDLVLGPLCSANAETVEGAIESAQNNSKNHTHPLNCDKQVAELDCKSFVLQNIGGGLEALGIKVRQDSHVASLARRCLPLKPYRPRKIFQLGGVHKMTQPSKKPTVMCECFRRKELCATCSGRIEKIKSVDGEFDQFKDLTGVLDDSYHRSLAVIEEKPVSLLVNASLQTGSWEKVADTVPDIIGEPYVESEDIERKKIEPVRRKRRPGPKLDFVNARTTPGTIRGSNSKYKRRKYNSISSDVWEDSNQSDMSEDDDEYGYLFENGMQSPSGKYHSKRGSGSVHEGYRRKRDEKFDIDNIVIPYSIASTTRVEKIEYKEIITPSWRVIPNGCGRVPGKNGICSNGWDDAEIEDLSMEVIQARHERSEVEEHKKFNRNPKKSHRRSRRLGSKAEYSEPNTPDPMSPNPEVNENFMCSATGSQSPLAQMETPFTMPPPPGTMLAPVVTEAVAALAVSALKMNTLGPGRRRTMSSTNSANSVEDEEDHVRRPTITPWEKRTFPLNEDEFVMMRSEMPEEYLRLCDEDEMCGTDQPS